MIVTAIIMWAQYDEGGTRSLLRDLFDGQGESHWPIREVNYWRVVGLKLRCAAISQRIFFSLHTVPPPLSFLEILKMYLHNTQAMFECNSLLRLVFDAKYEFLIKETVPFIKKKLLYKYTCALWILF